MNEQRKIQDYFKIRHVQKLQPRPELETWYAGNTYFSIDYCMRRFHVFRIINGLATLILSDQHYVDASHFIEIIDKYLQDERDIQQNKQQ